MVASVGNVASAINAYQNAAKGIGVGGAESPDSGSQDNFSGLVKSAIQEAVKIGEKSENISIAALKDGADLNEVVTAVSEAKVTLETVVAIRDRVIEAYRDIIRMPI